MAEAGGADSFHVAGDAYDSFMGRYSQPLAERFVDAAGIDVGHDAVDVGCGPGALTGVLLARLGPGRVAACDPSPSFVDACAQRHPGVEVRAGTAESIPFDDAAFDAALAQLVLHFVSDPDTAVGELRRVVRPGGVIGASVWEFTGGMQMLRLFWDAALAIDRAAPDEASTMRFGRPGEIVDVFDRAGLTDIDEQLLTVSSTYRDFDELWATFLAGVGPAGSYCVSLTPDRREALRTEFSDRLGNPTGAFGLDATAICALATVPA